MRRRRLLGPQGVNMTTYQENPELGSPPYSLAESAFSGSLHSDLLAGNVAVSGESSSQDSEEVLIADDRANLGPAELVEHKLGTLLRGAWLPVSHMRLQPLQGGRSHC